MNPLCLIAAIDLKNGIGKDNQLLCHLPADLSHFRQLTTGHTIIMGRKTFLSIGKPLPNRQNIVLSSSFASEGEIDHANSLKDALAKASRPGPVYIIGGASLFNETIGFADQLFITKIHHVFAADTFFPDINSSIWYCDSAFFRKSDQKNAFDMTFCHYRRRSSKN